MITGSGKGEGSVSKTPELKSTNTSDTMHTADEDLFSLLGGHEPVYAAKIKLLNREVCRLDFDTNTVSRIVTETNS